MRAAFAFLIVSAAAPLVAQPVIRPKGIVNAAAFQPVGVPGGAIARGSMFSIFGSGLGPAAGVQVSSFPLPAQLAGVSVKITQGSTSVDAFPAFVIGGQLNVIMPSNAPLGLASVKVTFNGQSSNPARVLIVNNNPGLFTSTGFGIGPGSIQNFVSSDVQPLNSPLRSAQPGQFVTLWATGLGPITQPDNTAPPVATLPYPVEIFVGGQAATNILYSGRSPCCSSIDQIVFQVPANAPSGCYVPVVARVAGSAVSNTVSMSIAASGGACADAFNPLTKLPVSGGTMGIVALRREVRTEDVLIIPGVNITADQAIAYFGQYAGGEFAFDPYLNLPPPGTCTTYVSTGNPEVNLPRTFAKDLSAGNLSVAGTGAATALQSVTEDVRYDFGLLGLTPQFPGVSPLPLYLNPGIYRVSATGSTDVGAFTTNLTVAAGFTWTNRNVAANVDRSQPLTLNWTGSGTFFIRGTNRDYPTNSSGTFLCNVPAGATSFTIPPYVLAPLPQTRPTVSDSDGYIEIHSIQGTPQAITATKLTTGIAVVDFSDRRSSIFR